MLRCFLCAGLMVLLASPDAAAQDAEKADPPKGGRRVVTVTGLDAVRHLSKTGKHTEVEKFSYVLFWDDFRQPEAMHLLASSLAKLNRREEAATWSRLLLRVAEEYPSDEAGKFKPFAINFLKFGEAEHLKKAKEYEASAGGEFPGVDQVSDLWMTQVQADLHSFFALKLTEGENKAEDDNWIHKTQGTMHRSGAKHVADFLKRKGLLFTVPHPRKAPGNQDEKANLFKEPKQEADAKRDPTAALDKEAHLLGRPTRVTIPWRGKGSVLRVGTRAYETNFILEVSVQGRKIGDAKIQTTAWSDLKFDLPAGMKPGDLVTLELITPPPATWSEGAWLDYVDFFTN